MAAEEAVHDLIGLITWNGLNPPPNPPLVQTTLEGVRRLLAKPVQKESPLSLDILTDLVKECCRHPALSNVCLVAACLLAVAGFLRCGKLINLRSCDIKIGTRLCIPYCSARYPNSTNFFWITHGVCFSQTARMALTSLLPPFLWIALNRNKSLDGFTPANPMYHSSMATGHVRVDVQAITNSSSWWRWSVLLEYIVTVIILRLRALCRHPPRVGTTCCN